MENHLDNPTPANGSAARALRPLTSGGRTFRDYLNIIRDWWYLGLLAGLILGGLIIFFRYNSVPLYSSQTLVRFDVARDYIAPVNELNPGMNTGGGIAFTLINHISDLKYNLEFLQRVVDSLSDAEETALVEAYRDPSTGDAPVAASIIQRNNRTRQQNQHLFVIEFQHRDAEQAAFLANRFAEEYARYLVEENREDYDSALRFQRSKVEELRRKVEMGELELQAYRQERQLVSLDERRDLINTNLRNIHTSLNQAQIALLGLEARVSEVERAKQENRDLLELPQIANHPKVQEKADLKRLLETDRAILATRYGSQHPRMKDNQAATTQAEIDLESAITSAVAELEESRISQSHMVEKFREELALAEQDSLELDRQRIEYEVLQRRIENERALYERMLSRYNETQIASQLIDSGMTVIARAAPNITPVSPSNTSTFFLGGLALVLGFICTPLGLELLINRLKSRSDVESYLGVEYLGEILRLRDKSVNRARIVLDRFPREAYEMFRVLYSHISLVMDKKRPKTFVVTSAVPGEGKSFMAANLAAAFSSHHHRVLLIDGDLRHPTQHRILNIDQNGGLQAFLQSSKPVGQSSHYEMGIKSVKEHFDVLTAGARTEEATEFIRSARFAELLTYLKSAYDIIVIDSPPAGVFPDALALGDFADHFIFVARPNRHSRGKIRHLLNRLNRPDNKVLGLVFNMVSPSRSQRYATYEYDYNYYGKYYDRQEREAQEADAKETKEAAEAPTASR